MPYSNDNNLTVPDHIGDIMSFETGQIFASHAIPAQAAGFRISQDAREGKPEPLFKIEGEFLVIARQVKVCFPCLISCCGVKNEDHATC